MKLRSPGSATIVNAIATGFGSAFGIDLDITLDACEVNEGITCLNDVGTSNDLIRLCALGVYDYYGISPDDFGLKINSKSKLPMASGLSSSSALSNGVVALTSRIISQEFNLKELTDFEIINLAIDVSLKAKVTITGAFDDATASYFGGVTLTSNLTREIIARDKMDEKKILIFMPDYHSFSGDSDVNRMKLLAPLVSNAFEMASLEDYYNALTLNGLLYCSSLGFDSNVAIEALNAGALASGLSGTGSSYVAICEDEVLSDVKDAWASFEGQIIDSKVDNVGLAFK